MVIFIFILGLILGSFINALVWRTRQKEEISSKDLSILKGRSICPKCKHILNAYDLIPIASWLYLKGKCRYCHKNISIEYPLVELLSAILFSISYIFWPLPLMGLQVVVFSLWLVILVILLALFIYDYKWKILPTHLIYIGLIISLIYSLLRVQLGEVTFLNIVISTLIGGGIFYLIYQISRGKWIGGGDVRLGYLLGLTLGTPVKSVLMLFIASLLGCIICIPLLVTNKLKKDSHIPFGPFLIFSAFILVLTNNYFVNLYLKILGI